MKLKVVLDCNVFLQAVTSLRGPARLCLDYLEAGDYGLYVSADILSEVKEVLARPVIRRQFKKLTDEKVDEFMALVLAKATLVYSVPTLFSFSRDPDDEPYLNLAIHIQADYLVTRDNDLLALQAEPDSQLNPFRLLGPNIQIVNPNEFTTILWNRAVADE